MTQYNNLIVNLLNSHLSELKSAIKNETEVVLRLSSNMIGDNETNFSHKVLRTNRQVSNLCKAFGNGLSKIRLSNTMQSGAFLSRLLGPLLKTVLLLIKNVIKPLAKSVLISLGLTAAASAVDRGIRKKILGSGHNNATTLIIPNNEIEDIDKIVKSLEHSALLLKGVTETVQHEVKQQKGGFLSMLLGTLGASLLGNILTGRWAIAKSVSEEKKSKRHGREMNRAGKGGWINRASEGALEVGHGSHSSKKWIFNADSSFS